MNLQQLEYIVAVDQYRHFVKAAEHCFVTQATLSMMIKKLEEELNVKLFDRSKHPVIPTIIGSSVIEQAKVILKEVNRMNEMVIAEAHQIKGLLRVGIIPTLAPYILPLFLKNFQQKHPDVQLQISELTTDEILQRIKLNKLDAGIMAIPLNDPDIVEIPLFNEEFVVYSSYKQAGGQKKFILPAELDVNRLWLLEEGHCLRSQILNICELKGTEKQQFKLTASSLETLKKVVDIYEGITILPALSLKELSPTQLENIYYFQSPVPARKIGMICFRYFAKEQLLNALKQEIVTVIPEEMITEAQKMVIAI